MEMSLITLTPVWTGGMEVGKMDRIKETGIIGSLRWWYETIVRGLGGQVCSAADERREGACLCDVCRVFGTTGWKRRFRLEVVEKQIKPASFPNKVSAQRSYEVNGKKKTPAWWLWSNGALDMQKPKEGSFSLKIESLFPDFDPRIIAGLIQFLADHAAIGARAQLGFGLVKTDGDRPNLQPLYECLGTVKGDSQYPELPSLKNIFLAQIQLTNMTLQETFNLKYDLRRRFANNPHLRHFVMGKVNGKDRTAAKVKMSLPYDNGRMRVWGWIPEKADAYNEDWDRDKVVNTIYQHLKQNHKLLVWREMNSFRDTVMPGNNDPKAFLRSLLGLEGEENAT